LVQLDGDDAATEGWAQGANNLTHNGSQTGSGVFLIRAQDTLGMTYDTDPLPWAYTAAVVDNLAPTKVTGFKVTPATNSVNIVHNAASDAFDGVTPAAGMKDYQVKRDNLLVATVTAALGLSPTYTVTNIGNITSPSTPTAIQNGKSWTLTAAGNGIHGHQADECLFLNVHCTADEDIIGYLNAYSSPNQYSTFGLMVRTSLDPASAFIAVYIQPQTPGDHGTQVKRRVAGSNSGNVINVTSADSGYYRLHPAGAGAWLVQYNVDGGGDWITITTVTSPAISGDYYKGIFLSSQLIGSNVTCVVDELNSNNVADLSYNVPTNVGGTWTVTPRDNRLNVGPVSKGIIAAPDIPSVVGLKWHPGHYVWLSGSVLTAAAVTNFKNQIIAIGNNPNIKGYQITTAWASLEGPTLGAYTAGINALKDIIATAKLYSKRIILMIKDATYGSVSGPSTNSDGWAWLIPKYIMEDSQYGGSAVPYGIAQPPQGVTWSGGLVCVSRNWTQVVMDRIIALSNAYAVAFDNDPNFEMIGMGETSMGVVGNGFSGTGLVGQLQRWLTACTASWPHTQKRIVANYVSGSDALMLQLFNHGLSLGQCAVGGPDPEVSPPNFTLRSIQANRLFRNRDGGGFDYRGTMPWVSEIQEFTSSVAASGYVWPTNGFNLWYDYCMNLMHAQYMIWLKGARWTEMLAQINLTPNMYNTVCPTSFPACSITA
jgi:hypothetical protein